MSGLNKKQEMFVQEYVKTGNMAESYRKAYGDKDVKVLSSNACRLLKNERVSQRVEELRAEASKQAVMDIAEIYQRLTAIARMETQEETVVVEGLGEGVSEARIIKKKPSLKNATDAMNLLLKCKGAFKQSLDVTVSVPVIGGDEELDD